MELASPSSEESGGSSAKPESPFTQGFRWDGRDAEALPAVLEAALDYRGDVTLTLEGGEEVEGYLFARESGRPDSFILVLPSSGAPRRRIPCDSIRAVAFTGRDAASGASWESWLERGKAKKKAESRRGEGGSS